MSTNAMSAFPTSCLAVLAILGLAGGAEARPDHVEPKPWFPNLPEVYPVYVPPSFNTGCLGGLHVPCDALTTPANITSPAYRGWFTFEAEEGALLTVGTAPVFAWDDTDTYITLLADDCVTVLGEDDDAGPARYSLIQRVRAPYAGEYHLQVRGYAPSDRGRYRTYVQCLPEAIPPANDECPGAELLERCADVMIQGDMTAAGGQYDLDSPGPSCTGFPSDGRDIVYALDLRRGDVLHVEYKMPEDDASLYVVQDCADVSGSCLVSSDRGLNGEPESIDYPVPETGRYFLILDSYGVSAGGAFTLRVLVDCVAITGGCCAESQACVVRTIDECAALGGDYLGDDSSCRPGVCGAPVPTVQTSWGAIKNRYR